MSQPYKPLPPEAFTPVGPEPGAAERLGRPALGFWRETGGFLLRDPVSVCCAALLLFMVLGAVFIPMLSPLDYAYQNTIFANKPPMSTDSYGVLHLLGTDNLGRDVFIRLWYGLRISLSVAAAAALIDCAVGVLYGGLAGYLGGMADNVMMRVVEIVSGIPYMIVVLLLMAVLPRGAGTLILAYTLVGWTGTALLVRGQVVSLRQREFMTAARVMGAGAGRSVLRHLLPNLMGVILVNLTLDIPGVLFTEAFLSMLGLGIPPPYPSLGVMASDGIAAFRSYPTQLAAPALAICLAMLSFNLLGDRLQDAQDPKMRRMSFFARGAKRHKS